MKDFFLRFKDYFCTMFYGCRMIAVKGVLSMVFVLDVIGVLFCFYFAAFDPVNICFSFTFFLASYFFCFLFEFPRSLFLLLLSMFFLYSYFWFIVFMMRFFDWLGAFV